jgi:hypothetical protein
MDLIDDIQVQPADYNYNPTTADGFKFSFEKNNYETDPYYTVNSMRAHNMILNEQADNPYYVGAKSDKFGPASAFLNYQSTHSGAVLSSYFAKDLTVGALAESEALKLLNLDMLALMRESVGSQSEQAAENAYHLLASHIGAISPAGEITLGMLRWQDVLAAERYDSTYARSYYRMLREEKTRIAQAIFLNGATSLPR